MLKIKKDKSLNLMTFRMLFDRIQNYKTVAYEDLVLVNKSCFSYFLHTEIFRQSNTDDEPPFDYKHFLELFLSDLISYLCTENHVKLKAFSFTVTVFSFNH